ncbi:tetratricopeptide repeat protein [Clostridium tarantellae]|uniref:Tetratricopeptide repeat protein n=1 Tax=Clostridium tarantellae TaxID=39493 RepID=A0A6I1MN56_9CLOT|nr:tetratricopeptide repeat protein [Clostridium tarantellae]MPQ44926.1 tetratricopeptide repeat protein [Clostridium tarantellae]
MKKLLIFAEILIIILILQCLILSKNYLIGIPILCAYLAYKLYKMRPSILAFKGNIAFEKKHFKKALNYYNAATKISYSDNFIKLRYAYIALNCGELDECKRILDLVPFNQLNDMLKNSYKMTDALYSWKSGNLKMAIDVYENIHNSHQHTLVYETLGYLLLISGDYKKALKYNEQAYDYDKDSSIITDNLAQSYFYLENYEKAKELYSELLLKNEKKPSFPEPYYYYGLLLNKEGNKTDCIKYLKEALKQREAFLSELTHEKINKTLASL